MLPAENNVSSSWAIDRYEDVRSRLPDAAFPERPFFAANLAELQDEFDAFVFDSFGVLNVGETPIEGAGLCIEALRADNKQLAVLTNAATVPLSRLVHKYVQLGFQFEADEIISSREVLADGLRRFDNEMRWGVAAPLRSNIDELPGRCHRLDTDTAGFDYSDGFILLSSQDWTVELQAMLADALAGQPRPVLVGNPDIVAPREGGLSLEPGAYAHQIADTLGVEPAFYGKPFGNAFAEVASRFEPQVEPRRIAMIGDSFHTDILGGAAAGWRTVLVTDHGLVKDLDVDALMKSTGVVPDFVIASI
ncbi:MAG: HAD-IIA family hydrolase [Anderseniella sp.]